MRSWSSIHVLCTDHESGVATRTDPPTNPNPMSMDSRKVAVNPVSLFLALGQSWSGGTFSKSQHRQPEFDPRIDAQKIVLTVTLTLTLPLTLTLTVTLTLTLTLPDGLKVVYRDQWIDFVVCNTPIVIGAYSIRVSIRVRVTVRNTPIVNRFLFETRGLA